MNLFRAAGPTSGAEIPAEYLDSSAAAMQRLRQPFAVPPAEPGAEPAEEPVAEPDDPDRQGSAPNDR